MLLSLLDKCLFWQEIASWLARELSKVAPENIFLVFSTTYKRHASIWMLSKEKTIQKLRNFLRSGGKKLRSWP
ncbi:hypothetical protein [Pseudomonas entomophila]|uniref:Uncharacterized protein n=1 Tax=Pseudomonas entomophila TaxID=312306 RepID=A0ABY9QTG1_9PSED|nr:hypothetical protein [Pseudomonas entomophila]WMW07009.1 hypothetical protein RAH46_06645 [Pseudomonas entomophila]